MISTKKIIPYKYLLVGLFLTFFLLTASVHIKSENVSNESKPPLSAENNENPFSFP
jgi:hypothetical protein